MFYAIRQLLRAPAFAMTTTAILTLAVGASAAIFSMLYALVLRPLPVPHPEQLVQISTRDQLGREADLTWGQFNELLRQQRAFTSVIGSISQGVVTVETGDGTVRASIAGVTTNYFSELGAVPAIGRLIQGADMNLPARTGEPAAVLGWGFWQRQFGGSPSVIGTSIRAEGTPLTIVGVAPRGFLGLGITIENDVTIPLTLFPRILDSETTMIGGTSRWVSTTARLASGTSLESARSHVDALWPALRESAMPAGLTGPERDTYRELQITVTSGSRGIERGLRARYTQPLVMLLAISVLILLIAAVNLGSLMFVRLESARHELAIRFALGARRRFVVCELASQGIVLGVAGALGAVVVATYTSQAIAALLLKDYLVPTSLAVAPDARVIALTIVACIGLTAMVSALAAWAVTAPQLVSLAPAGVRTVARSARIGRIFVSAQAALAIVLLTGASLLQRNILRINAAESGLTSDRVLVGTPLATFNAYRTLDVASYYREALGNVEAVPGVSSAAFTQHRPQRGAVALERVGLAASPRGDGATAAETALISPRFFDTLGIAILQGRDFRFNDGERSARVAIVSHHLATRLFGQGRGVGERIRVSNRPELQDLQVIGIVSDARVFDIRMGNLDIVYMPALQSGRAANFRFLIARAPTTSMRGIQQAIESLGVETMRGMQTMDYWRGRTLLQERVMAALGSYFGLLALVLVAAGVYGLLMYALSLRRKELGIRMALGADSFRIARAVLAEGAGAAGVGLAIGLVAAVPSVRLLQRVLVAVTPHDPIAIAGACVVLLAIAGLASLAPAIRAARVEPLAELRRD